MKFVDLLADASDGNPPSFDAPESLPGAFESTLDSKNRLVTPSRLDLAEVAGRLQNNKPTRELGNALMAVYRGLSFAQPGERDSILWSLVSRLAALWPDANVEAVCRLFSKSAETMEAEADVEVPILDALRIKWDRAAGTARQVRDFDRDLDAARRREAWRLVGQDRGDALPLGERIMAYHGSSHFVRIGDQWHGPVKRDWFTPASLGVLGALYGTRWNSFSDLARDHGVACGRLSYVLGARATTVIPGREIFVAGAPTQPGLVPRRSAVCERLIANLGGDYAGHLVWWLAGLLRNDVPCRALILGGPKHTGKSMLLSGLGGLWEDGYARMRDVLGKRFNSAMGESWLAVSDDDEVAKTEGNDSLASFIRSAVSDRVQSIERKHHDVAKMRGCMRYAFATNDAFSMISGAVDYKMNTDSLSAFGDRILHIPVSEDARGWWTREGINPAAVVAELPGHVLWLHEAYGETGEPQERFWVREADPDLARYAVVCTGLRGDVLLRLAQEIAHAGDAFYARRLDQTQTPLGHWAIPRPGQERDGVLVSPAGLYAHWGDDRPHHLSLRTVGQTCKALADASWRHTFSGNCKVTLHALDRHLIDWYVSRTGL